MSALFPAHPITAADRAESESLTAGRLAFSIDDLTTKAGRLLDAEIPDTAKMVGLLTEAKLKAARLSRAIDDALDALKEEFPDA